MPHARDPIDFAALARLEECRISTSVGEVADESRPFAGGRMCRGSPGSWFNCAHGPGLAGPVSTDEVREFIDYYESRGIEPRVELTPFADPSLVHALAEERFVLRLFETIFFRRLDPGASPIEDASVPGIAIRQVDPSDEADVEEFARVATAGFLPPGMSEWPREMLESVHRTARHPRVTSIMAMADGRCIGAGSMETAGETGALFGVSVDPAYRRRGVQSAMIAWRLRRTREMGVKWITIGTRPGVATERNAQRAGFAVAYTKSILVRPGEGLTPVME